MEDSQQPHLLETDFVARYPWETCGRVQVLKHSLQIGISFLFSLIIYKSRGGQ